VFFILVAVLTISRTMVGQKPETETSGKVKVLEGALWATPSKSSFAVEGERKQFYTLAPTPNVLLKYGEVDWKKVEAVWVLGEINAEDKTIKPEKIQIKVAGVWRNLESADLANKLVCEDKICRNCKVKCGGTCKCTKWK